MVVERLEPMDQACYASAVEGNGVRVDHRCSCVLYKNQRHLTYSPHYSFEDITKPVSCSSLSVLFTMQRVLALGLLGSALAHPAHVQREASWKPSLSKRVVDLEQFRLSTTATYVNTTATTSDPAVKLLKRASYQDTATALVQSVAPNADFRIADSYVGNNGISVSIYAQPSH